MLKGTCKKKCFLISVTKKKTSKVNTILKVVIFKHSAILFRCSMICRWPEPWNFKTSHFRILIRFHPIYRPCFYFIRKHITPFYWQQKLPDNWEYIKIQRMAFKTILCTKKYLTSHSLKIPIVMNEGLTLLIAISENR